MIAPKLQNNLKNKKYENLKFLCETSKNNFTKIKAKSQTKQNHKTKLEITTNENRENMKINIFVNFINFDLMNFP